MDGERKKRWEWLICRYELGERSDELLRELNQEAFNAFHAPWETQETGGAPEEKEVELELPRPPLPLEVEKEHSPGHASTEGLRLPPLGQRPQVTPLPEREVPTRQGPHTYDPLYSCCVALEKIGHIPYLAMGRGVTVHLPHEVRSDNQSVALLLWREGMDHVELTLRGDVALSGITEGALAAHCAHHNTTRSPLRAELDHPGGGGRPRVQLLAQVPRDVFEKPESLASTLFNLFRAASRFWVGLRGLRPLP